MLTKMLEKEIAELRKTATRRRQARDKLIEHRLQSLLLDVEDDLDW